MTLEEVYTLANERLQAGNPLTMDEINAFANEVYNTKGITCNSTRVAMRQAKRTFIERMSKKHQFEEQR